MSTKLVLRGNWYEFFRSKEIKKKTYLRGYKEEIKQKRIRKMPNVTKSTN